MDSSRRSGRSLQYEPLEAREMMAVVTGSLKKRRAQNHGHEVRRHRQLCAERRRRSTIAGVGSWSASQVNSIVIDLKKGNDTLSLNSLANGGGKPSPNTSRSTPPRTKTTSSISPMATTLSLNGSAKKHSSSQPTARPALNGQLLSWNTPTPPAPRPRHHPRRPRRHHRPTNWFDSHVLDTALRNLGHNLYTDGLIDRNDMISLLRNAEDGSVVDATELTDLRTITSNTTLFGSFDYVWKLSSDVVNANTANAKYQGTALGNLAAGSSSAQMEKLVNKWFLGLDRPTAGGAYRQVAGQLFVNGATYTDIHQGNLGDCYFMSSLGEVALKNQAAITNMFIVNGDGTYTVRFFQQRRGPLRDRRLLPADEQRRLADLRQSRRVLHQLPATNCGPRSPRRPTFK